MAAWKPSYAIQNRSQNKHKMCPTEEAAIACQKQRYTNKIFE